MNCICTKLTKSIFTVATSHVSPSHMVIEGSVILPCLGSVADHLLVPDSPTSSDEELAPANPPPPVDGTLLSGGTSANDDILVIACGHCDARNLVETSKDFYYVVFKGRGTVGVYWSLVSVLLALQYRCDIAFRKQQTCFVWVW